MKTLAEIYASYPGLDKGSDHSYLDAYAELLAPYRRKGAKVLEIGLGNGASLRMWEEYFEFCKVYGVDISATPTAGAEPGADLRPMIAEGHRISIFDATDANAVREHFAGILFDVIIDDASHLPDQQIAAFHNFRPHLAPDGLYIIEDVYDVGAVTMAIQIAYPLLHICVFDLRHVKGRHDDVLVVVKG